jgi:hypothetical protein
MVTSDYYLWPASRHKIRYMPTVYLASRNLKRVKFHRGLDCNQLRGVEPVAVDLAELPRPVPCRTCYPDAPRAVSAHRRCFICNPRSTRPCEHNGGVPVRMTRTRRKDSLVAEAGETYTRVDFVWPELARHYRSK